MKAAKKQVKLNKGQGSTRATVVPDDEEEEEDEPTMVASVATDETEEAGPQIPVVEDITADIERALPQVEIPESDTLDIVFLQELFDYPVIGQYNFHKEFGINRVRLHQRFTVPRDVALTLMDKKLVTIPSMVR